MNAEEARVMSIANANLIRQKEADRALQIAAADAAVKARRNQQYRTNLMNNIRFMIDHNVSSGRRLYSYPLRCTSRNGPYSDPYGKVFLMGSEYQLEIKSVMDELEQDGYTVYIYDTSRELKSRDLIGTLYHYEMLLRVEW